MKFKKCIAIALLAATVPLTAFKPHEKAEKPVTITTEGKAWWFAYYTDVNAKKYYITDVYNNNCNHCANETRDAFRKWLILNDYSNSPSITQITALHDVKESSAEERREKQIIKFKEMNYTVVKVGFTYDDEK